MRADIQAFRLRWPHYLLAVAAYLVLVLLWAPAGLMTGFASERLQNVRFDQARGSFWNGQAEAVVSIGDRRVAANVTWRFRPIDLLAGRLGYAMRLEAAQFAAEGIVRLGPASVALQKLQARAALPWLLGLDAGLARLPLAGTLNLKAEELLLSQDAIEGQVQLDWLNARFGQHFLGRHRIEASGEGNALALRLRTLDGPLDLEGKGAWPMHGELQFVGTAHARTGARELQTVLNWLGPERNGVHAFRYPR